MADQYLTYNIRTNEVRTGNGQVCTNRAKFGVDYTLEDIGNPGEKNVIINTEVWKFLYTGTQDDRHTDLFVRR